MSGERFTLVITAVPSHRTATQRLKELLKSMLRTHGFRCDQLRPALHDEATEQNDDGETNRDVRV